MKSLFLAVTALSFLSANLLQAQSEEKTLQWIDYTGRHFANASYQVLNPNKTSAYTRIAIFTCEKDRYEFYWTYTHRDESGTEKPTFVGQLRSEKRSLYYQNLSALIIRPIIDADFAQDSRSLHDIDYNKTPITLYTYTLNFRAPVVTNEQTSVRLTKGSPSYLSDFRESKKESTLQFSFRNIEEGKRFIKAFYHHAETRGAKPDKSVPADLF